MSSNRQAVGRLIVASRATVLSSSSSVRAGSGPPGAGPDEFRTAPLWGVGQRVFFLHDGRTTDLVKAIEAHKSHGSEASRVIDRFYGLSREQRQDIVNFLRAQ